MTDMQEPEEQAAAEVTEAEAAAPETTENETKSDPASEPGLSLDDALSETFDKMTSEGEPEDKKPEEAEKNSPEKDDKKEASEPEKEDKQEEEAKEPVKPAIDPPSSWSKEMKAKWADVPPEAQEIIATREKEAHTAITKLGQEVNSFKPMRETLDRYSEVFKANNLQPEQGVARLLEVQSLLDKNPIDGVRQIAKTYGVDLEQFAYEDLQEDAPEITSMRNEISELKRQITEQGEQTRQQSELAESQGQEARLNLINEFSKDKPYFEKLQKEIYINIPTLQETLPGLEPKEYLEKAYEMALYQNSDTRSEYLANQQNEAMVVAKEKALAASKAAELNVSSSALSAPVSENLDDDLARVWNKSNR